MQRSEIFRTGVPALIAVIGLVVFAYLSAVRRDRLARYWAGAWGLLLARYAWNALVDQAAPVPHAVNAALRIGFAGVIAAGVWSLERPAMSARPLLLAALGVGAVSWLTASAWPAAWIGDAVTMAAQAALLCTAAWWLHRNDALPPAERRGTGLALVGYAVTSTLAISAASGSAALMMASAAAWTALLLTAFGFLALCFRQAYEAELAARDATSQHLTRALGEFVSVCMHCRAVRDEQQQWQPLEKFVSNRRTTQLSHGLCDACARTHYGDLQPR